MDRHSCLLEISRSAAARFIRVGRDRARRAAGRVVLGSLVCAASLMCATSAQAQPQVTRTVDDQQDYPFSDYDPCIASVVAGQGHFHSVFVDRSTATTTDTTFKIHENGVGANTVPGDTAKYQFAFSSENRFRSSSANFTFRLQTREHIIREGQRMLKDDYFVRSNITFSSNSTKPSLNRETSESTCK